MEQTGAGVLQVGQLWAPGPLVCPSWEQETPASLHGTPATQRPPCCTCTSGDAAAHSAGGASAVTAQLSRELASGQGGQALQGTMLPLEGTRRPLEMGGPTLTPDSSGVSAASRPLVWVVASWTSG